LVAKFFWASKRALAAAFNEAMCSATEVSDLYDTKIESEKIQESDLKKTISLMRRSVEVS
jgi:hypothetical protein